MNELSIYLLTWSGAVRRNESAHWVIPINSRAQLGDGDSGGSFFLSNVMFESFFLPCTNEYSRYMAELWRDK